VLDETGPVFNDKMAVNMRGATMYLYIPANSEPCEETIGELRLGASHSMLRMIDASGKPGVSTFRAKKLARDPRAMLSVMCQHSRLGNTFRFMVDDAAASVVPFMVGGGGAAGTKNISILPFVVGGNYYDPENADGASGGFFTYGSNGLRRLETDTECYGGELDDVEALVGTAANVHLPDGDHSFSQDARVNALAMRGSLNAAAPATLTVGSGLVYGVWTCGENVAFTTGNNNPLRWIGHYNQFWGHVMFNGKITGAQDFIKGGPTYLEIGNSADWGGFSGNVHVLEGQLLVNKLETFKPGTGVYVARRARAAFNRERLGDIGGNGEFAAGTGSLIFGNAGNRDFNGTDVIFDGAAISPGDMRPGIMTLTTGTRSVNLADATLNIRIDGFDLDKGRKPLYDILGDEFYDEMHDALYINGNGTVTLGADITVNVDVNPVFKIPRNGAEWVILTADGPITPGSYRGKGTAGIKQINNVSANQSTRWTVDAGTSVDGRDALILRCEFNNNTIIMVR